MLVVDDDVDEPGDYKEHRLVIWTPFTAGRRRLTELTMFADCRCCKLWSPSYLHWLTN